MKFKLSLQVKWEIIELALSIKLISKEGAASYQQTHFESLQFPVPLPGAVALVVRGCVAWVWE